MNTITTKTYRYRSDQRLTYVLIFSLTLAFILGLGALIWYCFNHLSPNEISTIPHGGGGLGGLAIALPFALSVVGAIIIFGPIFIAVSFVKISVNETGFKSNLEAKFNPWSSIYEARISEYQLTDLDLWNFLLIKYNRGLFKKVLKITDRMPEYAEFVQRVKANISKEANLNL